MVEAEDFATMLVSNELVDSENENPKRGKTKKKWVKKTKGKGCLRKYCSGTNTGG